MSRRFSMKMIKHKIMQLLKSLINRVIMTSLKVFFERHHTNYDDDMSTRGDVFIRFGFFSIHFYSSFLCHLFSLLANKNQQPSKSKRRLSSYLAFTLWERKYNIKNTQCIDSVFWFGHFDMFLALSSYEFRLIFTIGYAYLLLWSNLINMMQYAKALNDNYFSKERKTCITNWVRYASWPKCKLNIG